MVKMKQLLTKKNAQESKGGIPNFGHEESQGIPNLLGKLGFKHTLLKSNNLSFLGKVL